MGIYQLALQKWPDPKGKKRKETTSKETSSSGSSTKRANRAHQSDTVRNAIRMPARPSACPP